MTLPVKRNGDGVFLLTQSCVSKFFLLAPSEEVNELFEYAVSRAAIQHNIAIFAKAAMSNHIHIVAGERDLSSDISAFKQSVSANLTMGINNKYDRQGSIWVNAPFHEEQLHSPEAILNAIAYVITNPVAAGLVARPEHWPGVVTKICQLGTRVKTCQRPKLLGKRSTQPITADLSLDIPAPFKDETVGEFQRQIADLVNERIDDIVTERRSKGLGRFLGVQKIRKQTIDQRPKDYDTVKTVVTKKETEARARYKICPHREAWLYEYNKFLEDYYEAFDKWQTDKTVAFPAGTYKMRKVHNVRIQ